MKLVVEKYGDYSTFLIGGFRHLIKPENRELFDNSVTRRIVTSIGMGIPVEDAHLYTHLMDGVEARFVDSVVDFFNGRVIPDNVRITERGDKFRERLIDMRMKHAKEVVRNKPDWKDGVKAYFLEEEKKDAEKIHDIEFYLAEYHSSSNMTAAAP